MNDATIRKPRPSLSATSGDPSKYPLSHPPPPPPHYRHQYGRHEGEGMMDAGPIRSGGGGEKVDYDSHQTATRRQRRRRPRGHYRDMKEHDDRDYSPSSYRSLKYSNDYDHGGDEDGKRSQSRTRGGIGGGIRRRKSISKKRLWNGASQRSKRNTKSRSHRSRSSSFRAEASRSYSRSRGRRSRRRYSWSPLDKSRSRSSTSSRRRRRISRRRRDRRDDEKRYIDGKGTRYALTRRRYRSRSRSRTRSRSNSSWRYRHDVKQRYGRRGYQREMNGNEYVAGIDAESHVYGVVSDDENVQRRNRVRDGIVDDGRRRRRWTRRRSRSRDYKREVKRRHDYEKRRRKRKRKERDYSQSYGRSRSRSTRSHGSGGSMSSLDHDDSYGHFEGGAGTVIDGRYKFIKDVGLGTFGRVVQAIDLHHYPDGNIERLMDRKQKVNIEDTVAIKIVRDVKRYHESAMIEADILKDVNRRGGRGQSLCAVLLNHFDLKGHCCLVFECLGRSLYDFMKTHGFKPFPLYCVRDFARQLLKALEFIHSFGLIHTDLKPENILLKSNKERQYRLPDGSDQQVPASTSIKLIDFGGATYDHEKKSTIINTRQYRSPEVILGLGWSMPSDMWSAGCIVAELYKGDLLFATHDNFEHLALMERIVGRFPFDMVSRSKEFRTSAFDSNGWHKLELSPSSKSYVRKTKPLELVVKNDDRDSGLLELLQSLLTIEPCKRSTASEALMNTSLFNARWS